MPSPRRLLKFARKRVAGLPSGSGLPKYLANSVRFQLALQRKSVVLPYPNSVMLELTSCCNLDCITCPREYQYGQKMDIGHMNIVAAKKLFDEIGPYLDRLGISGLGETFLYPHLVEFLTYARKANQGLSVFVSSNLSLPNTIPVFGAIAGLIDTLQVSVDGVGGTFETIRKKSKYDIVLERLPQVVSMAKKAKVTVKLNMVVFGMNYRQMPEVVSVASQCGIEEVYLNRLNPLSIDRSLFDESLYKSDEFQDVFGKTIALAGELGVPLFYPKSMQGDDASLCKYPWNNIYITWDGYMVPCCAKPFPKELNFGNVFERGFLACLDSEAFVQFRQVFKDGSIPEFCRGCC